MKTSLMALALVLVPLLSTGCGKKPAPPLASPDECKKACEHVANLQLAPAKAKIQAGLHELDEKVEATEDVTKVTLDRLKLELAAGGPPWNEAAVRKMPPAARRAATEQHRWEEQQLKQQREQAVKAAQEAVVQVKQEFAKAKQEADEQQKKLLAEALAACTEPCLKGALTRAQCLQRTQAVQDFAICDKQ